MNADDAVAQARALIPPPGMRWTTARYCAFVLAALGWLAWRREWVAFALVAAIVWETSVACLASVRLAQEAHAFATKGAPP